MELERLFKWVESLIIRFPIGRDAPRAVGHLHRDELGRDVESGVGVSISQSDLAKHCYILGATGCGKTSLILRLIEQDLKHEHSLVVVDLRGDLVQGALGLCAGLGVDEERVRLIDLRERGGCGFDPLRGAGEAYIRALHVLDVVAAESESWGVQLEETLRSALLLLAGAGETLVELERVFYDDRFRHNCLQCITDHGLISFWGRYEEMSAERRQTWALPVLNKVTPLLAVPVLQEVLGTSSPLDLGAFLSRPGSVLLVSLSVDELHRSSRMIGSLLISAISREMMARVNVPEPNRNPVRLFVDEFENMASESFEGLIAEGRRFGLTLVLSHQTLSQLPTKLRSVIRNNVGIQIVFQCGFEDARVIARELPEGIEIGGLRGLEVGEAYIVSRSGEASLVRFAPPRTALPERDISSFRALLSRSNPTSVPSRARETPSIPKIDLEDLL